MDDTVLYIISWTGEELELRDALIDTPPLRRCRQQKKTLVTSE